MIKRMARILWMSAPSFLFSSIMYSLGEYFGSFFEEVGLVMFGASLLLVFFMMFQEAKKEMQWEEYKQQLVQEACEK